MPATPEKYRPLLFSELVSLNSEGKADLCRPATLAMLYDMATLGAWTTNPNGSRWGKARIVKTLRAMRNATGEPDRGSYNQGHVPAFLQAMGAPANTWEKYNRPWRDIVQSLKDGYAVELSGDVRHTPAGSPLRKYVNPNVGHNIALVGINPEKQRVAFIDPMTPHGVSKYVRWAPYSHFKAFAKEFADGTNLVAGRVKKGRFSIGRVVREQMSRIVLDVQKKLDAEQKISRGLEEDLAEAGQAQVELQKKLQTEAQQNAELFGQLVEALGIIDKVRKAVHPTP